MDRFRDLLVLKASDEMESLKKTIQSFIETPDALSLGEDFVLLSSAKFEIPESVNENAEIDVTKRVGLNLILPLGTLLPLERRVQWASQFEIPIGVLNSLADGAVEIARALGPGAGSVLDRFAQKFPKFGKGAAAAVQTLLVAVELAGPELQKIANESIAKQEFMRATLAQFRLDQLQGVQDKVLRTAK